MPQRTLQLITSTDDDRPVYVAGTFNDWTVADPAYRMEATDRLGHYHRTFELPEGERIEYKYTRGGWEGVELDEHCGNAQNHSRTVETGRRWSPPDRVHCWASPGLHYRHDLLPKIEIIHENFEIPQLIRTRRVAALLPHNYYEQPDKRYPVLYLQDGQNLFDDAAPYGSWGVDKRMAALTERGMGDLIIVSIDHGDTERVSEFTPSFDTRLGRGDGGKYVRFLAETLKPYIDDHYRTQPGPTTTGIGGSSLGGLVSIYAGLLYPNVYDRLMIFSPSLWVAPRIPVHLTKLSRKFAGRVYLYGGEAESKTMVSHLRSFRQEILDVATAGRVEFRIEIDPLGKHTEARWGAEFPRAVEWLFFSP